MIYKQIYIDGLEKFKFCYVTDDGRLESKVFEAFYWDKSTRHNTFRLELIC